jgi:uncharacterized protein (DUF433 family)
MTLPDFLTRDSGGAIHLTGHRIGLFHLVRYYNEGYSPEMLVCQYPTLPLALVHKVIAFYLENRAAVDAYVAACRDELSRQRAANPRRIDVAALRQRLEALQKSERP